jgi:hypothetical protein
MVCAVNFELSRTAGIEPTRAILKTAVLPLNYVPLKKHQDYRTRTAVVIFSKIFLDDKKVRLIDFRSPLLADSQLIV